MKRFLLFGGDAYYPLGGWSDYLGQSDTLEEAIGQVEEINTKHISMIVDWWHVLDIETRTLVASSDSP